MPAFFQEPDQTAQACQRTRSRSSGKPERQRTGWLRPQAADDRAVDPNGAKQHDACSIARTGHAKAGSGRFYATTPRDWRFGPAPIKRRMNGRPANRCGETAWAGRAAPPHRHRSRPPSLVGSIQDQFTDRSRGATPAMALARSDRCPAGLNGNMNQQDRNHAGSLMPTCASHPATVPTAPSPRSGQRASADPAQPVSGRASAQRRNVVIGKTDETCGRPLRSDFTTSIAAADKATPNGSRQRRRSPTQRRRDSRCSLRQVADICAGRSSIHCIGPAYDRILRS